MPDNNIFTVLIVLLFAVTGIATALYFIARSHLSASTSKNSLRARLLTWYGGLIAVTLIVFALTFFAELIGDDEQVLYVVFIAAQVAFWPIYLAYTQRYVVLQRQARKKHRPDEVKSEPRPKPVSPSE